jgi:hypothetical protein
MRALRLFALAVRWPLYTNSAASHPGTRAPLPHKRATSLVSRGEYLRNNSSSRLTAASIVPASRQPQAAI